MDKLQFIPASSLSLLVFLAIVSGVIAALVVGTYFADVRLNGSGTKLAIKVGLGALCWLGLLSIIVLKGSLESKPFQVTMAFFAISNLATMLLALSPVGKRLALGLPLVALVGFQTFRLPLELVLHQWAQSGTIPGTMTWSGSNFDIVTGLLALVAIPFVNRSRVIAWVVNIIGGILLLNVMRVAMMSSPFPFSWKMDQPLQLVWVMPYALIVPVCVAGALAGHIILTRALLLSVNSHTHGKSG
jgi:hypothetical protein